jgi:hypothetical protein
MTFIEFNSPKGRKYCFVGSTHADVMEDTHGGTMFGGAPFSSYREITEEEARAQDHLFLDKGIKAIQEGICKSYMVGVVY